MKLEDLFDHRTIDERGCWLWTGTRSHGYGYLAVQGQPGGRRVHRVAWCLANGREIPAGLCVTHACDVPACFNPDHLRLATHAENIAEVKAKGRWPDRAGERNSNARIDHATVEAIRNSPLSNRVWADALGLDVSHVWRIRAGKTWRL